MEKKHSNVSHRKPWWAHHPLARFMSHIVWVMAAVVFLPLHIVHTMFHHPAHWIHHHILRPMSYHIHHHHTPELMPHHVRQ